MDPDCLHLCAEHRLAFLSLVRGVFEGGGFNAHVSSDHETWEQGLLIWRRVVFTPKRMVRVCWECTHYSKPGPQLPPQTRLWKHYEWTVFCTSIAEAAARKLVLVVAIVPESNSENWRLKESYWSWWVWAGQTESTLAAAWSRNLGVGGGQAVEQDFLTSLKQFWQSVRRLRSVSLHRTNALVSQRA